MIAGPTSPPGSFFFQAEDGIRAFHVTGVQTCALPIVYRWPGKYEGSETGLRMSRQELDALRIESQLAAGASTRGDLIPGNVFKLDNHPDRQANHDYLLIAVEHRGQQPQVLEEYSGSGGSSYS